MREIVIISTLLAVVLISGCCTCCPTGNPGFNFGATATPAAAATPIASYKAPTYVAPFDDGVTKKLSDSDPANYQVTLAFWNTRTGVAFEPQTDTRYISSFTIRYTPEGGAETTSVFQITPDSQLPTMHVYSPDKSRDITVIANYKDGKKRIIRHVTYMADRWVEA